MRDYFRPASLSLAHTECSSVFTLNESAIMKLMTIFIPFSSCHMQSELYDPEKNFSFFFFVLLFYESFYDTTVARG
jgi:hypothetical protein